MNQAKVKKAIQGKGKNMNNLLHLTHENYFAIDADKQYMSVSQYKSFRTEYGGCEAAAVAKLKGEWQELKKDAFLEGSYVHAWQEGKLEEFKANNPDLYSSRGATAGQLKSNFLHCNKMIEVLGNDPFVMRVLSGQKEVIFTAEMFGVPWKIMIDSYAPDMKVITDLKTVKEMDGRFWNKQANCYENFIWHYGYALQLAVYAEVERLANNREQYEWFLPHMVVVTKESEPDHEVIYFDNEMISTKLFEVEVNLPRVLAVKKGEAEPERCEKCAYCRSTKKVKTAKHFRELDLY